MSGKTVNLCKNEADTEMVHYLEKVLQDAKNGDIVECVVVGRMVGGDRLYSRTGVTTSKFEMLGMLQDAVARYWDSYLPK